jgi:hypothetical protein
MGRHTKCDDLVLFTVKLELGRVVALVAIEDLEAICALRTSLRMFVEMLNPF